MRKDNQTQVTDFIIRFCLLISGFAILAMSQVPPVFRDELTHHLAIPKLWIHNGGLAPIPRFLPSYYPMNLELLYLIPLYIGNDIIPKMIHCSFGLLTAMLIYRYLKTRTEAWLSWLGVLIFLTTPVVVKLSISAYVDLGLVFFSWASVYCLLAWANVPRKHGYLVWAAISCGLGLGTKYNGLLVLVLLTLSVPLVYARTAERMRYRGIYAIGLTALFVSIALVLFSPWMIRNYRASGNPVFPLYANYIGNDKKTIETSNVSMKPWIQRKLVYKESAVETALIPIRIFFQGEDDHPRYFDGKLNPMLCLLPLLLFFRNTSNPIRKLERRILAGYSMLFLVYASFMVDMRIRYIAPIIPPLVVLSVLGLDSLYSWLRNISSPATNRTCRWLAGCVVAGLLCLNAHYMAMLFHDVDPLPYIFGKMSRDAYIQEKLPDYPAIQFVNRLPRDNNVVVLALFLGKRLYYFDQPVDFRVPEFAALVQAATDDRALANQLITNGFTHCIIGMRHFEAWANQLFDDDRRRVINRWLQKDCRLLFSKSGYAVLQLNHLDGVHSDPD